MTSDNDKAKLSERLTGHHDPKDPDGLLTVEDVTDEPDTPPEAASSEYPPMPGRFKATAHDRGNDPI